MSTVRGDVKPPVHSGMGNRLREVRGDRSQQEFAVELGIATNTLRRYESAERIPDADLVLKLSVREGVEPMWLLAGKGPKWASDVAHLREQNPHPYATPVTPETGTSKKSLQTSTDRSPSNTGAAAQLPDADMLRGCIEALEELDNYRKLAADKKARAIVALYDLCVLNERAPRDLVRSVA